MKTTFILYHICYHFDSQTSIPSPDPCIIAALFTQDNTFINDVFSPNSDHCSSNCCIDVNCLLCDLVRGSLVCDLTCPRSKFSTCTYAYTGQCVHIPKCTHMPYTDQGVHTYIYAVHRPGRTHIYIYMPYTSQHVCRTRTSTYTNAVHRTHMP